MPIKTYWESEGFVIKASGKVTAKEIFDANETFLQIPKNVTPKYQLLNALEVEDSSSVKEVDLVDFSVDDLALSKKFPDMKIALVAKEGPNMEKFIKYMKISWAINTSWDIRVFNSLEAARNWLGATKK